MNKFEKGVLNEFGRTIRIQRSTSYGRHVFGFVWASAVLYFQTNENGR